MQTTVLRSLLRHRQPELLHVGDRLPDLEVLDPADGRAVSLRDLLDERPLVLVFGSHT